MSGATPVARAIGAFAADEGSAKSSRTTPGSGVEGRAMGGRSGPSGFRAAVAPPVVALLLLISGVGPLGAQGSGADASGVVARSAPRSASLSPPSVVAGDVVVRGSRDAAVPAVGTTTVTRSTAALPPTRPVSLDLRGAMLGDALKAVAAQSGAWLVYDSRTVPLDRRVSLRTNGVSATEALRAVLRGTGVAVRPMPAGELVLVRADGADGADGALDAMADAPVTAAILAGRVTDAESGAPLASATVTLDGTSWRAVADDDGRYRIAGVEPGQYTITARRLGYAPTSRPLTVGEQDERATLDLALRPTPNLLGAVVVTGTVVPTEVKAVPVPVSVVTATDLARLRPATVGEVFRQAVPSAVAWDFGANPAQTVLSARGASSLDFGGGTMKVYLDGVEISDRTFAAVDPQSIERIEVIRGPQAATIYGSDAIGGVMQITTKRGDPRLTRPQLDLEAAGGAVQGPYAAFGGRTAPRQEYSASVRGGSPAATYDVGGSFVRTGDWLPEGGSSLPSLHGGVRVVQGRFTFDLSGRHYAQRTGAPVDPHLARTGFVSLTKPNHLAVADAEQTVGARLGYASASWLRHELTLGVDRFASASHTTRPVRTTPDDTLLTVATQHLAKTYVTFNTSASGAITPALTGSLTAGIEHATRTSDGYSTSGATTTTGTIALADGRTLFANRSTVDNTGVFAQGQLGLHDVAFLTAGLRAEHNSTFGRDLGTPLSPRIGLSVAPTIAGATVKLRASYGEAIRPPSPGQRDALVAPYSVQLANPRLGPERQAGWDGGVDLAFGARGRVGATYYDQTGRDLIQLVFVDASASPLTQQYQNVGRVQNSGIELEGVLRLPLVDLSAQFATTRSRLRALASSYTGDLRVGDQLLLVPKRTGGVSLTLAPGRRTSGTVGLSYVGSWTYYDTFAELSCFGGTAPCRPGLRDYQRAYPAVTKINLSLTQQVSTALAAFVSVKNLANNDAFEFSDAVPVTGRVTVAGLRMHF